MAGFVAGDSSHCVMLKSGECNNSQYKMEESDNLGSGWYFSRKEIEENSPSRRDGIDLKKEAYHRKTYCTFLQDLGMRLKVPQVTIATAIVFCHRFFLRQSHAKNDKRIIATMCMFLAGKVEETPRPLKDVIIVSYEIIHKKDPSAVQKIKQKEVYEQQKELILLGERMVLTTLGFDLNVHHPYKPLVEAIKKFKVAQNALAQVAWNFVNDGLRTSLCLQFKPHHIAAGAIFLAAKFLKVKLPSDGDKVWWQEFDVTPRQLEDVSNQMLELYEQNRATQLSHPNEVEESIGGGTNQLAKATPTVSETSVSVPHPSQAIMAANVKNEALAAPPPRMLPAQLNANSDRTMPHCTQNKSDDTESADTRSGVWDHNIDGEGNANSHCNGGQNSSIKEYNGSSLEWPIQDGVNEKSGSLDAREWRDDASLPKTANSGGGDSRYCNVITKIDKDKVKAALEKRKKSRNDVSKKIYIIDEDDLIERELENGIEVAADDDKMKPEYLDSQHQTSHRKIGSKDHGLEENIEEGELSSLEEHELPSPKLQNKGTSWPDNTERDRKKPRYEIRG